MHENITPDNRERLTRTARTDTGPFVNPAHLRAAGGIIPTAPPEWLIDVLGRVPDGGVRWLAPWEITLVVLAAQQFPPHSYPSPSRAAATDQARRALDAQRQAAEQITQRQRDAWEAVARYQGPRRLRVDSGPRSPRN